MWPEGDFLWPPRPDGTAYAADAAMALEARAATETVYDSAGRRSKTIDAYGRETTYTYDGQDRVIQTTRPDPDGDDTDQSAPVMKTYYDSAGRVRGREDALGHGTGSVLDEAGHTTEWTYGAHGQMITETITVSSNPLSRAFEYDAAGQLRRRIDRNGRGIDTSRDDLLRQTAETWYRPLNMAKPDTNLKGDFGFERSQRGMV